MLKNKIISALFLTSLSFSSFAGFLVDPYIGFKFGSKDQTVKNLGAANGTYEDKDSGYAIGSRLGYSFLGLMGGLDFNVGSITDKADSSPAGITVSGEDDYSTKQVGLFLGYELPILFRFWGTYYFTNEWEAKSSNTVTGTDKGDTYSGSGFGLGVGFTGLPIVSINLEYKKSTFDEFKDGVTGAKTSYPSNFSSEVEASEIFLSVSAPFDF